MRKAPTQQDESKKPEAKPKSSSERSSLVKHSVTTSTKKSFDDNQQPVDKDTEKYYQSFGKTCG